MRGKPVRREGTVESCQIKAQDRESGGVSERY